jgi:hypothetical protein
MSSTEHARQRKKPSDSLPRDAPRLIHPWRALQASSQALRKPSHPWRACTRRHRHDAERGPRTWSHLRSSPRQCLEGPGDSEDCHG